MRSVCPAGDYRMGHDPVYDDPGVPTRPIPTSPNVLICVRCSALYWHEPPPRVSDLSEEGMP